MFSRPLADIDRIFGHVALFQLSINMGTAFSVAFLLRQGLAEWLVMLAMGVSLALRFLLRPLVLWLAPAIGLRRTAITGVILMAAPLVATPAVEGLDAALASYIVSMALGECVYWTSFHSCFASAASSGKLGGQVGFRQAVQAMTGVLGPPLGGLLLTYAGSWTGFVAAALVRLLSAAPLVGLAEPPPVKRDPPPRAWSAARFGALVFLSDGWVFCSAALPWSMVIFTSTGERFDAYGTALAAAALVGAFAGYRLGKGIDRGKGVRAVAVNLGASLVLLIAQGFCGTSPAMVVGVMILGSVLGGFSVPALLTAVYAQAREAPCTFRFQFAAEGGWDIGGALACFACAAVLRAGATPQTALLLAAPMLLAQAWLLHGDYAARVRNGAQAAH